MTSAAMGDNILVYLFRRDLRVSDNPVLHHLATADHGFTHLLPLVVFPAQQMEVSGFVANPKSASPYPEARSRVGGYWRCGPHRAKFIAESVWNLKESLESLSSGLVLRVGMLGDVVEQLVAGLQDLRHKVGAVWMIGEEGVEERRDERAVAAACEKHGVALRVWLDEKYFVDDRDLAFAKLTELPQVFTDYKKMSEPLREKPRKSLPRPPGASSLPRLLDLVDVPPQPPPFTIPDGYAELERALVDPVRQFLPDLPPFPENAVSAHPFRGGEDAAHARLRDAVLAETVLHYDKTRNGLLGVEFSTKLSAYLALGCLTARQIHEAMVGYEDGTDPAYAQVKGYGEGENDGTRQMRTELLWRDYNRLCARKAKAKLFRLRGIREDENYPAGEVASRWKTASEDAASPDQDPKPADVARILERFVRGTTGMGLIDASQRELIHTGYTSNRARQNVAGFLAKHLGIDWRYGAEWYESMLVDYDVSSNWANWQYVSGVGNDPRSAARIFNPVKQAFDYDPAGAYVRAWVPEIAGLDRLENLFQACTASAEDLERTGLKGNPMVTDPLKRIEFVLEGRPNKSKPRPRPRSDRRPYWGPKGGQRPSLAAEEPSNPPSGPQTEGRPSTTWRTAGHRRRNSQGDNAGGGGGGGAGDGGGGGGFQGGYGNRGRGGGHHRGRGGSGGYGGPSRTRG